MPTEPPRASGSGGAAAAVLAIRATYEAVQEQPLQRLALTAAAAAASAAAVLARPEVAVALPVAALAAAVVWRPDHRYVVAAVLAFLPVQELVLSHVQGALVLLVRYGPELVVNGLALVLVLTRFRELVARAGALAVPLALVIAFWALTALWNAVSPSTALIGLRSELRFLPVLAFPLLSRTPWRDASLYGRVLVFLGAVEAVIALVEFVGGARLRALFAPQYDIVIEGVSVGKAGPPLTHIFGTFGHRNLLGIFLALAWIVLASAGARRLGFSRRAGIALGILLIAGLVVSASREGAVALIVGALVIAVARYGRDVAKVAAVAAGAAAVVGLWTAPEPNDAVRLLDANSIVARWQALFTHVAWSPETNFRLQLLVENARLAAEERPIFGFGIGTASDPRVIADRSSPVYRNFPGLENAVAPYLADGNWAILILEVGFVGTALLALLLLELFRLGMLVLKAHWSGLALAATVPAIVALGFFTSVLQQRPASFVLWLLAGIGARAAAADRVHPPLPDERDDG